MSKRTDIQVTGASLYLLPVQTRVPLKFGPEVVTHVTCARVKLRVADVQGRTAVGWGETPLSVQWVWPSKMPYEQRYGCLERFCHTLTESWSQCSFQGHPIEVGHDFVTGPLPHLWQESNKSRPTAPEPMPWLAALICCSPFDLALHDAYGQLHHRPVYTTYNAEFMNRDLADYLIPETPRQALFPKKFPQDFLLAKPAPKLRAWHLVGGLDPLEPEDLTGSEPSDGYPVLLRDWIKRDGLKCLKIKLRGTDAAWDLQRLIKVGKIALEQDVDWLSADFNCTVNEASYVNDVLDRLRDQHPRTYGMILYVEQPFPYDLEHHRLDVHSVSARKPLFLDESAHDWRLVRLGRHLGWSGVALKTCKTQTGALLSACWAKAHGMSLMVQDLTNPMLAQIPHVTLAAWVGTLMGVETNAMQFYPAASQPEAVVHPGLYQRRRGVLDLSTIEGPGFGYRLSQMNRELPAPAIERGELS